MVDKGGTRQPGKFTKNGKIQPDQKEKQSHTDQEKWPVDEIASER